MSANFLAEGAFLESQIKPYMLKVPAGKFYFIWARNKGLSYDQNVLPFQGNSKYPIS